MRSVPIVAAALLSACSSTRGPQGASFAGGGAGSAEEAVAFVDGRAITAGDVRAQALAAGTDARTALSALVDAELLAAEAVRRGFDREPAVTAVEARELVRRYLQGTFEKEVTREGISDTELRKAYLRVRARLDHPELRVVRQVLAPLAKGDDDARKAELRRRATEVAARARGVRDPEAFSALAKELSDGRVTLRAEQFAAGREWNLARPFLDATFALPSVGASTDVVETQFGFHVIFLEHIVPEERITYEQAREKLRESLWPDLQRREFARFVDRLVGRHRVDSHPERLGLSDVGGEETDEGSEAAPGPAAGARP
jgi:parvulin-like peptidyl-prolyl isomerase